MAALLHPLLFCTQSETESTLKRDKEDDEKLVIGINFARSKGVIPETVEVRPCGVQQ